MYIILRKDNMVMMGGDNYATGMDDLKPGGIIHVLNGYRFDENFFCIEVNDIPEDMNKSLYKYKNGEFIK